MKTIKLKINPIALVIVLPLPLIVIGLIGYMFLQEISTGSVSLWSFPAVLVLIAAPVYFILGIVNEVTIVLNEHGVTKRVLFGRKNIDWKDVVQSNVTRLSGNLWTIQFHGNSKKIGLNLFFFTNVNEIVNFIRQRLPHEKFNTE
ncbi:MAG: hypothetical protein ACT4O9_02340 [Blastocatellia bacterium]